MGEYLVEAYMPRLDQVGRAEVVARIAAAGEALAFEGVSVRYLRSVFVPADETCFHVFEAASLDAVRAASERARLSSQRIVEAIVCGDRES